jgi:hypothetical protein
MHGKTTVRLISRGEEHPYVLEVTTPGWRGVDAAFEGPVTLPDDLKQISELLDEAGVKRWKGSDGRASLLLMADGTTEIVLDNDVNAVKLAVSALRKAGWLVPAAPPPGAVIADLDTERQN